jgi:hypothetical protein
VNKTYYSFFYSLVPFGVYPDATSQVHIESGPKGARAYLWLPNTPPSPKLLAAFNEAGIPLSPNGPVWITWKYQDPEDLREKVDAILRPGLVYRLWSLAPVVLLSIVALLIYTGTP